MPSTQTSTTFLQAPWSDIYDFSQIDPALGIEAIDLSLTGSVYSLVSVTSLEGGEFESTDTGTVTLRRPDGSAWLTVSPSASILANVPASSGAQMLIAAGGTSSSSVSYVPGQAPSADAALLVGTRTVSLDVDASARVSASGPGNMTADFSTFVGVSASIVAETEAGPGTGSSGSDDSDLTAVGGGGGVYAVAGAPTLITTTPHILTVADASTGTNSTLTLNGFDPALGDLLSANISISTDASGTVAAENLDPVAEFLTVGQTGTVYLDAADGSVLANSSASFDNTVQLAAFDGVADFSGPSSDQIGESAPAGTVAATAVTISGAEAASFETNGTVSLEAFRAGHTAIDGPGNLDLTAALQARASVTVSYTYLPGNVTYNEPPPGRAEEPPAATIPGRSRASLTNISGPARTPSR